MFGLIVLFALAAVGIVYWVGIYNGLVGLRERVKTAWANVDVVLKLRQDELPQLLEACERCMQFEQETFERVLRALGAIGQASAAGNIAAVGAGEQQLRAGMGRLFAIAENDPRLKTDESFRSLQSRIRGLEEAIADQRELYNEQVNLNNIRIGALPDAILARWFGFEPAQLFDFLTDEKRDIDLGALFGA